MEMKKINYTIIGIATIALSTACNKSTTTTSTTSTADCVTISYKTDIEPIMSANCTSCHNSNQASGGVNLSTYANVSKYASSSLNAMNNGSMPPSGKLASGTIQKLNCWISQGKLNN